MFLWILGILALGLATGSMTSESSPVPSRSGAQQTQVTPQQWAALQAGKILLADGADGRLVFADDFESGNTSAWSQTMP